jgi:uncharacterized membrane protein
MTVIAPAVRGARPQLQPLAVAAGLVLLAPASLALLAALALGRPLPWQFHRPWVSPHVAFALLALALGLLQFALRKGDRRHRLVGYGWCALMTAVGLSGLWVQLIPGHVTMIHRASSLFAVADLVLVPLAIWAGRTGRRRLHRNAALSLFACMINAGALAFLPQRAIGALILGLFH